MGTANAPKQHDTQNRNLRASISAGRHSLIGRAWDALSGRLSAFARFEDRLLAQRALELRTIDVDSRYLGLERPAYLRRKRMLTRS